jgi:hypothetical protein
VGATSPADFASVTAIELATTSTNVFAIGTIDSIAATPVELSRFSVD